MKLCFNKNSNDPIYYIQQGIRNGKKTTTKTVYRIGKHSELLSQGHPDPLQYAKDFLAKYNENYKNNKIKLSYSVDFSEKVKHYDSADSKSTSLNIGYFILQSVYCGLNLNSFFTEESEDRRFKFNCDEILRFLTYDRIMNPRSKLAACKYLDTYYEQPVFTHQQTLRFMDFLEEHYDHYLEHLFINSNNIVKRDTSVCYYDCTNFYFETEDEDPDIIDEVTGEFFKGFRKYGPSKQHQPLPLVQMGLFMDGKGIPISMTLTSGSDNEQTTVLPLENKIKRMFKGKPFIYCADAGLGSTQIRTFNSMGGNRFIVTQSIKKLSNTLKTAVFNDFDYRLLSSNEAITIHAMKNFDRFDNSNRGLYEDQAYKVLEVENFVDLGLYEDKVLKDGTVKKVKSKGKLKQKIIITFSRKMMEYQRMVRNKQIARARILVNNKMVERVKKGPNDVTRFIKKTTKKEEEYIIDEEIIKREEMYDGYYAIATNLDSDVKEIFEINSKRYKIEDCFRVMKTNFDARPVHHRLPKRIVAHFMVCYTALLVERLLEAKLEEKGEHFTINQIIETIKAMNVVNIQDSYYQSIYSGSRACDALNAMYGLELNRKYYLPKDLNKKIKKIIK